MMLSMVQIGEQNVRSSAVDGNRLPFASAAAPAPVSLAHRSLLCTHGCYAAAEAAKEDFCRPAVKIEVG
jgi:hypothetical protein